MVNSRGTGDAENFFNPRGGHRDAHPTSHMSGKKASGGNILFLDGHVSWRNFPEMKIRQRHGDGNQFYF